jgi:hypothetical protein
MTISTDGIEDLARRYGLEADTSRRLQRYLALLEKWNSRVNLTATTEWRGLGILFEEGIWAARLYPVVPGRHLDIGSGAGFPALPIAILHPETRFDLLEPRARRAAFLETVAAEIGLRNVTVHAERLDRHVTRGAPEGWGRVSWKGISLGAKDLRLLLQYTTRKSEFWLFHGAALPVADPVLWGQTTSLRSREAFLGRDGWFLSIYVSRET